MVWIRSPRIGAAPPGDDWLSWTSHWKSSIVSGVSGRIQAAPFSLTAPIRLSFRQTPTRCRVGVGGKLARSESQRILVTYSNVCYTLCQMILERTGHVELPAHAGPGGSTTRPY